MTKHISTIDLTNDLKLFGINTFKVVREGNEKFIFEVPQGFLMISLSSHKKGYQVDYIHTKQEYQRQGHATSLFKAVSNVLKCQGIQLHHSESKTPDGSKWAESLKGVNYE